MHNRYLGYRRQRPLTCLADAGELTSDIRSRFDDVMPLDFKYRRLPRKWWEWDYIADCAESLDLLRPDVTALGLGVGSEPLISYFARFCKKVIATDLYSNDTAWKEAKFETLTDVMASSPLGFPHERLELRNCDMRTTKVESSSCDFVWSCSSIEHVPTLKDVFDVFREIERVLRVGGKAIITTEFCISGGNYLLPGVNALTHELLESLLGPTNLRLVGPTDLDYNFLHPGNAARPRRYLPVSTLPGASPTLSFYHRAGTIANPVGMSIIAPIGFVLEKQSGKGVPCREALELSAFINTLADGLDAFFLGDNDSAVRSLSNLLHDGVELQTRLIAWRFLIDAKARSGEMGMRSQFKESLNEFAGQIPPGPIQDADCIDIIGYLLGEIGEVEASELVYRKCLLSPSTSLDHLLELLPRYIGVASRLNRREIAIELGRELVADLRTYGTGFATIKEGILRNGGGGLPEEDIRRILS